MDSLKDIFRTSCFLIPDNQRAYSWRKVHAEALISDLEFVGKNSHYCGPIIVSPDNPDHLQDDESRDIIKKYILDDGQQRLTTCLMLMSCLFARFSDEKKENEDLARDLKRYLFFSSNGKKLRIRNSNQDLDLYLNFKLMGAAKPATTTSAMKAMDEVHAYFKNLVENYSISEIKDLTLKVVSQLKFIVVDLGSEQIDRYLAFDAINARGLALSEFDKIKNFCALLQQRRSNLKFSAENAWYKALVHLENYGVSTRPQETTFIAEAFSIFFGDKTGPEKVHESFAKKFDELLKNDNDQLEKELTCFVNSWVTLAEAFGFVASEKRQNISPKSANPMAFRWLTCIDHMGLPGIMRTVLCAAFERYNKKDFEKICKFSEIYIFRVYGFIPRRVDQGKREINQLANEIFRKNLSQQEVSQKLCKWLDTLSPMEAVFKFLTDGEPKYPYDRRVRGWTYCYYFLYQYELSVSPKGTEPIPWIKKTDHRKSSIEHIMPQHMPKGGWWAQKWSSQEKVTQFKHRMGNLVLSNGNEILGAKSFPLKMKDTQSNYYYSHNSATNSEKKISDYTNGIDWGEKEIRRREIGMIEFAMDRWRMGCCSENDSYNLPSEFSGLMEVNQITVKNTPCIASETIESQSPAPANTDEEESDHDEIETEDNEPENVDGFEQPLEDEQI